MKTKYCIPSFLALASVLGASAATFTETFTYPNGNLVGQGGWVQAGSAATPLVGVSSGVVTLATSGQDVGVPLGFSSTIGTSLYGGFDVALSAAQATGDYFFAFNTGATATNYAGRFFAKSSGAGYVLGLQMGATGATPTYATLVLDFGVTYRIVVRYDSITGTQAPGNDKGLFYINPISGVESENTSAVSLVSWTGTSTDNAALSAVSLRQGTAANSATISLFDNLIVSTDFSAAAAVVPEPSSFAALAGVGVLGFCAMRRRRSA